MQKIINQKLNDHIVDNIFIKEKANSFQEIMNVLDAINTDIEKQENINFRNMNYILFPLITIFSIYNTYNDFYGFFSLNFILALFIAAGLILVSGFATFFISAFTMNSSFLFKKLKPLQNKKKNLIAHFTKKLENKEVQIEIISYLNQLENNIKILPSDKNSIINLKNNIIIYLSDKNYIAVQELIFEYGKKFKSIECRIENNIDKEEKIKNYLEELDVLPKSYINEKNSSFDKKNSSDYREVV